MPRRGVLRAGIAGTAAVLAVAGSADVATAFAFAQHHDIRIAIRSGGHSYPGWSGGDGALVVDVRPLRRVTLSGASRPQRYSGFS